MVLLWGLALLIVLTCLRSTLSIGGIFGSVGLRGCQEIHLNPSNITARKPALAAANIQGRLIPRKNRHVGRSAFPNDFWFVKPMKVGSSTLAGVMRTICAHYGISCMNPPRDLATKSLTHDGINWAPTRPEDVFSAVKVHKQGLGYQYVAMANHGIFSPEMAAAVRALDDPFMFTSVREPVARTLSRFFHDHPGYTMPCTKAVEAGLGRCPEEIMAALEDFLPQHGDDVFR
jgi:hypothetical protein